MDTLTHMLLGACIGQAVGYRKFGAKAMVFGAVAAGLPDADVFFTPFTGEYGSWKYHRHITHALWFIPFIAGAMGWGLWRHYGRQASHLWSWIEVMVLAMLSHPLLDFCTIYGTQLLAPFSNQRFEISSVSIIDPIYSVILLLSLLVVAVPPFRKYARVVACAGIILTTSYLGYGVYLNNKAEDIAAAQLKEHHINYTKIEAFTTIFQPYLRRILVSEAGGVRVGFVSTFSPQPIYWNCRSDVDDKIKQAILSTKDAQVFSWFSNNHLGFAKGKGEDEYLVTDLRYGLSGESVFGWWGQFYKVTKDKNGVYQADYQSALHIDRKVSWEAIKNLFKAAYGQPNNLLDTQDKGCS